VIHELLIRLHDHLSFYPPVVPALAAVVVVTLALLLFGRSRTTILFCIAVALLSLGLAAGLFGIANPPAGAVAWGEAEELADRIVGPAGFRRYEQVTAAGFLLGGLFLTIVYGRATRQTPAEASKRLLVQDEAQRMALGSAHLCPPSAFRRWSRHDPLGWTLRGRFWGADGRKLGRRFSLGGEDIARGVAVFGAQGSGKTQSVILPAIADRMRDGHSLIVTDVQGELLPYARAIAAVTGHLVLVHNPSDPAASCALNLCHWIDGMADAQAMAAVLLSGNRQGGSDLFWNRAATNLLAACALHYPSFGAILDARRDLFHMAKELKNSPNPAAVDLAASFFSSMESRDPKLALNIMATASETTLSRWADRALRRITDRTDFDLAGQLTLEPTVLVLSCARRHTDAYGPYLGTILRVLTTRLDDLGQQAGGALAIPVGLILEEFPALGRLDSLVRDVNLVRKRRISVLTAAQSLAQFDHLYPGRGEADQLLAGLATKIVFGGCDGRTAGFFSELSGQQTLALSSVSRSQSQRLAHSGSTASLRSRALLLPDDVIRPARGQATVFAAYSDGGRADQAIFHARFMPFYKRRDWKRVRVQAHTAAEPSPAPLSSVLAAQRPTGSAEAGRTPTEPATVEREQQMEEVGQTIDRLFPEMEVETES